MTRHQSHRLLLVLLSFVTVSSSVTAATFVVPHDRELVRRAHAIVLATPLTSYTQVSDDGGIETVTPVRVEQVIKGARNLTSLNVVEPGGELNGRATIIPGVPRFEQSERVLLFLMRTGSDRWAVTELALGKFAFRQVSGRSLLLRDAGEIIGWDPDMRPHRERSRDAAAFLKFVDDESRGATGVENYFVDSDAPTAVSAEPLTTSSGRGAKAVPLGSTAIQPLVAPYTASSYTMLISGSLGGRWNVFPNAVSFFSGTTQEPGAPGGGATAITTAFSAWNNDCGSNVNYVYAGTDNGTHTQGLHGPDGANTVLFERDLSTWGVAPFSCSSGGYSGTLGIGGITVASGTHVFNNETFATTQEADVEMNRGIANCSLLFNSGDFNSAVAHEVGHTLAFRHSDQNRASSAACSTDASLECSSQAVMKSFISTGINAALQVWDQHAVQAVYPGNVCAPGTSTTPPPPSCTAPSITGQPTSRTITSGQTTTLSVTATGTSLTYQWYVGTSGSTASPIAGATSPSVTVAPTTTTSYWVRVSNSCGAANSSTATVTVNPAPAPSGPIGRVVRDFTGDGKDDILHRSLTTGQNAVWAMSGTTKTADLYTTPADPVWVVGGAADFDGDGYADILMRNSSTADVVIWYMRGTQMVSSVKIANVSFGWDIGGTGDFNNDGRADILWRAPSTGQNAVWIMGNGGRSIAQDLGLPSAGRDWQIVGSGQFDGAGSTDILWRNTTTGQVAIWLMNGTTVVGDPPVPSQPDLAWEPRAIGDYNQDGRADIVWRNRNDLRFEVWLMNGGTRIGVVPIGGGTDPNWTIVGPR